MSTSEPEPFPVGLVPLFPLFFVGLWLVISVISAYVSGWPSLAEYFRAAARPAGLTINGEVKSMGWGKENGVTHMIVSEAGLYLYANPLFRVCRPPLLIPWSRVSFVRERRVLFLRSYVFDLAGITTITVKRLGYEAIIHFLSRA